MGNCLSKSQSGRKPPDKSFEEHTQTKRHLRMGVTFEKTADGEFHAGIKSGIDVTKDKKVYVVEDSEKVLTEVHGSEEIEKIPRIVDLVMDQ